MRFLVYVPQTEFTDETLSTVELFLNKWGIGYDVASLGVGFCNGVRGARRKVDLDLSSAMKEEYDGIIITDGKGIETFRTYEYRPFLDFITALNNDKKFICAVNNGIKVLARANIVRDRKIAASERSTRDMVALFRGVPSARGVEISENVITVDSSAGLEAPLVQMFKRIETA